MIRVAVLDDYQHRADRASPTGSRSVPRWRCEFFHDPIDPAQLAATLTEFEVLVLMRERTRFPRAVLERLPKLQLLITTGMRNASVDMAYLHQRGVTVSGTQGTSGPRPTGCRAPPRSRGR